MPNSLYDSLMNIRALMKQLVKRVLAVGSGLSPDYRTCRVFNRKPIPTDVFTVAFHICLLQVGWEAV